MTTAAKPARLKASACSPVELRPRPPFRLDLTVWALRRRPQNAVDTWDGSCYRRTLLCDEAPMELAVIQRGSATAPRLDVHISRRRVTSAAEDAARVALSRMLGLDVDLSGFYAQTARDEVLRALVERFRGVKPPRFPSIFECLLNAVACQQLSIEAGLTLLNRLAEDARPHDRAPRPFPGPDDIAALTPQQLRSVGFSTHKAQAIASIAAAVRAGLLELDALDRSDAAAAVATLRQLRGIGPWSADYVLLRGLGRLDAFPRNDVGALKGLRRYLGEGSNEDPESALARWRPFAGLVYFHLLLRGLETRGLV